MTKTKYKESILKAAREKQQITYKRTPTRLSADFSAETLQVRREWYDIFKMMKGKNLQPRIIYPARLLFRFDGEIKSFTDKKKAEIVQHHQTSFTAIVKDTSLGEKEKATTRNKKKGSYTMMKWNLSQGCKDSSIYASQSM